MKNVLIVDDDAIFLEVIVLTLQKHKGKYNILTAENGLEAKKILEKEKISLLVTDIMMPECDGLSLLAYVNDRNYVFPCFIMSAYGTPEIRQLIPKDVLHFFSKPFPTDKLAVAIEKELSKGVADNIVSGISIVSFLLLVEMDKKTCLFEVILPNKEKGLFYFNKGVLFNAAFKELKGEDAVLSLLQAEKAQFRFKNLPDKQLAKAIEKDLSTLIKEAKSSGLNGSQESKPVKSVPAERLELKGSYFDLSDHYRGTMTVVNMSLSHVILKLAEQQIIPYGTDLEIEFILDDKPKSLIKKDVKVLAPVGGYLKCSFVKPEHYDRLGPYLHFNFLDQQKL